MMRVYTIACKGCGEVFAVASLKDHRRSQLERHHRRGNVEIDTAEYTEGLLSECTCGKNQHPTKKGATL